MMRINWNKLTHVAFLSNSYKKNWPEESWHLASLQEQHHLKPIPIMWYVSTFIRHTRLCIVYTLSLSLSGWTEGEIDLFEEEGPGVVGEDGCYSAAWPI